MAIKIPINGLIGWDTTPRDISEALKAANGKDVEFVVTSGGGFVSPGIAIFNLIRNYPGHTTAKLSGYAMSMASYIPLAADEVIAEDNAIFMIHNVRGFVGGDHNQILKAGAYMKGLSGILAARYVKRTGKTPEEISSMMDEETFFFGQEMVDAGFVDSIIDSDDSDAQDGDQARAAARAAFEEVEARMARDPEAVRADMHQAAAMVSDAPLETKKASLTPAAAGQPIKEEQQMATLADLLSKDPAAKAEFDQEIEKAKAQGVKDGEANMQATIDKVSPYLASKDYPDIVAMTALNVLNGKSTAVELTAAVAAVDAVRQDQASQKAAAESEGQGETLGQGGPPAGPGDGMVSSQEDLNAEIDRFKGGA